MQIDLLSAGEIIGLDVTARHKVALFGGAAVVLATAGGGWVARSSAARHAESQVHEAVRRASRLAERGQRLLALERADVAATLAAHAEFRALFSAAMSAQDRPTAAFVAIEGHNARLQQGGRKADLLLVLGADGRVLARDVDPRALFGEDLRPRFSAIAAVLGGKPQSDVWLFDTEMLQVSLAPLRVDDRVAGAIVVGYTFTRRDSRAEADVLGADVAYFLGGRVFASSLAVPGSVGEGGDAAEDVEKVAALTDAVLSQGGVADQALRAGRTSDIVPLRLRLQERPPELYLAAVGPLPAAASGAGLVVLASVTEPVKAAQRIGRLVALVGVLCLLALVTSVLSLARHFERRLDRVEVGVAEVISGNVDYAFEAFDEFEGLCNGLNVMLARLAGRPDPGASPAPDVEGPTAAQDDPAGEPPEPPRVGS